ncbi:MAG: redoxin domain-containing protein [Thermomicrobiales bacterium]
MDTILLLARIVLAAVFLVAGVAKLLDRAGSREGLEGFGVPAKLAAPGAILLPLAEIAVAVLLLPLATARWGGLGALALLLAFVAGIAYNMAKGRAPDCHCFGSLHSEPAGSSTLIRNAVLSAVAGFLLVEGRDGAGHSLTGWLGDLSGAGIALGVLALAAIVAVAVEGWLLVHLLGQNGRVLLRLDTLETAMAEGGAFPEGMAAVPSPVRAPAAGLPEGFPAPAFRLEGLHGETMTLDALLAPGKPLMVLFSDPTCGPCNGLLPDLGRWQRESSSKLTIAMVSRGTAEANKGKATEHGLTHVLLQKDREVSTDYKAHGTPTAVVIKADGTIGSPVAGGAEAIRALYTRASGTLQIAPAPVARPAQPAAGANGAAASNIGQPAPALSLPDLQGKTVGLADFAGKPALLVFWNPGCGFCNRMVDDLKAWEAKPLKNAPRLVLVSTGTVESNREMGLQATILLDEGFATGRSFGASGTPSAVLLDAAGKIASDVAVGSPGVLALANGQDPKKATNGAEPPAAKTPKKGDLAPAVKLKDLDGVEIDVNARKGENRLLVFWNPGCGYCRKMVDDLKAWETSKPVGGPTPYLISTGSVESNRELGLSSVTLLDEGFAVGRSFGATGTPAAVLIGGNGKIASEIAVGSPAVMALAGAAPAKV